MRLNADNLNNLGGRITGHDVGITTRNDLNNIGGTIDAVSHLKLDVGRDLNVATTTRGATSSTGAAGDKRGVKLGAVAIDRVAGLYVTGEGGLLEADVGRDANFAGAQVRSAGDMRVHAQGHIDLGTVTTACASGALGAAGGEPTAETLGRRDDTVQLAALMTGLAIALAEAMGRRWTWRRTTV